MPPPVDLGSLTLFLAVLDAVPEEAAVRHEILPLRVDARELHIAAARAEDRAMLAELAALTGKKVVAHPADPAELGEAIQAAYGAHRDGLAVWRGPRARRVATVVGTPPAGLRRTRHSLLIVDDEAGIRRIVKDAFAQRGYDVRDAASGAEAFQLIAQREPDALLLDAKLPDVHGFEIAKRLKASPRHARIPIVMVTAVYKGWRMAADLREAYGVAAVVEKPFDLHQLVKVVEEALAGRALEERPPAAQLSAEARRLYHEGAAAYRRGDLALAEQALLAARALDPLSAMLRHQLGLVHAHRGQDFAAIQELETALDLEPDRFQTLRNLAVLYQKHGFRRKACDAWERAIVLAPDADTREEIRRVLIGLL